MKKSTILSDTLLGLSLILICKLITNDDYFIFNIFTLLIIPLLFLVYFSITGNLKWWLNIVSFLICFISTNIIMNQIVAVFPEANLVDRQSFPLSNYYIIDSTLIVISKILLDILIKHFLPSKLINESMAEKVFLKFKKSD